jgi:Domain of unknown function (DUF4157)
MAGERLKPDESRVLGTLAAGLDLTRVRLHRGSGRRSEQLLRSVVLTLSGSRAIALGNHVFLPARCCGSLPVLAHELTHCAQYQRWGATRYLLRGAADRLRELRFRAGLGENPYTYRPEPGKPFEAYGMEQQGQIVEDCFRGDLRAAAISPYRPGPDSLSASRMDSANASTSASDVSNAVIQRTSDRSSSHT